MIKPVRFLIALVGLLYFSFGGSISYAFDYFTAEEDGQGHYLELVTLNHAEKVIGWIRDNRMENAIADLKYTLDRFPNHPKALQLMGFVSKMTNNTAMAITYYQKALSLYPQYAMTHAQCGQYLLSIGFIDRAIESLKRSVQIDPKLAGGYVLLAQAYSKNGESELARQAGARAKELGYKGKILEEAPEKTESGK